MQRKKVFVSGCYDMLHSGHVAFFKEASKYGNPRQDSSSRNVGYATDGIGKYAL